MDETSITDFFKVIIEHTEESIFLINVSGTIIFTAQESTKSLEGKTFLDSLEGTWKQLLDSTATITSRTVGKKPSKPRKKPSTRRTKKADSPK